MAAKKFLRLVAGVVSEALGVQVSAGAGNGGDIVALDDNGRIDNSMMPVGLGADVALVQASEALVAGDWVNIHNVSGSGRVRKADAATSGKGVDGFVLGAVASGANATVYFEGTNNQVTGQTPGAVYLQTTPGLGGATIPSANGNVVQRIGVATSTTSVNFERGPVINILAP